MTSKRFLSEKRNTRISFTTSTELKDWIEQYVKDKHKENPHDEKYTSISSFCHHSLHNLMQILEKGKDLDDFEELIDKNVKDYFETFSAPLSLPFVEPHFEPAIYFETDYQLNLRYYISHRKQMLETVKFDDINTGYNFFKKYTKRFYEVGLTKSININISLEENSNTLKLTLEHVGQGKSGILINNIFIAHTKSLLETFGFFGFKAIDYLILNKDLYCRIDFISTPLLYQKKLRKQERIALMRENVLQLINYHRIISEDKDFHLWMHLAKDKSLLIQFKDFESFKQWNNKIENEVAFYEVEEQPTNFPKILEFFERLHWIQFIPTEKQGAFTFVKYLSDRIKENVLRYLNSRFNLKIKQGYYYII